MVKKWKLIVLVFAAIAALAAMNYVGAGTGGSHIHSTSGETSCCPGH